MKKKRNGECVHRVGPVDFSCDSSSIFIEKSVKLQECSILRIKHLEFHSSSDKNCLDHCSKFIDPTLGVFD